MAAELRGLERLAPLLEAIEETHGAVYLVGGTVRDLLLGRRGLDLDLAIEGDGLAFAEALADTLGGHAHLHRAFGTAVVASGEDAWIDVVTARSESYEKPAALPTIASATIDADLRRRDFTVNAMAVSLGKADFGRLIDPFDACSDLEARVIRVLHPGSFNDDPTRIFRAIRYENRLGFRMDEETERLVRACIELGLVGALSSARLRDELVLLLDEEDVTQSILRLAELDADRAIHPLLAADAQAAALVERLSGLARELQLDVPSWQLGLAVLARRLPPTELATWLAWLKLRRGDATQIEAAVVQGPRILERLRTGGVDRAGLVALCEGSAPAGPLFALALEERQELRTYFGELASLRLSVTGADLAEIGLAESPRVGEVLAELRTRLLNGDLGGRDEQLAAARRLVLD